MSLQIARAGELSEESVTRLEKKLAEIEQFRSAFNGDEKRDFSKRLRASYPHLDLLMNRIINALRAAQDTIQWLNLYSKTIPNTYKAKSDQFEKDLDDIYKQMEHFLIEREFDIDQAEYYRILIRNLEKKSDVELLKRYQKKLELILKGPKTTLSKELKTWFFAHSLYYNPFANHIEAEELFRQNVRAFLPFYELVVLRNYLECLNRSTLDEELRDNILQPHYQLVQLTPAASKVAVLYRRLISMFEAETATIDSFEAFKLEFLAAADALERVDQVVLWKTSKNYLNALLRENNTPENLHTTLNWLKEGNESKYSYYGDVMPVDIYLSFFFVVRANQEVEHYYRPFETGFSKLLEPKYQPKVLQLCNGFLLLDEKKYQDCLNKLEEFFPAKKKGQAHLAMFSKSLRIMAYIMQSLEAGTSNWDDEHDVRIGQAIDNLKQYLKREKKTRKHFGKEDLLVHFNFVKAAEKTQKILSNWRPREHNIHNERVDKLVDFLAKRPVSHLYWLKSVVNLLRELK
jgi:hemerythrin-like domain-containing protein